MLECLTQVLRLWIAGGGAKLMSAGNGPWTFCDWRNELIGRPDFLPFDDIVL